ncbi:hypothetical protein [Pedobacter changchengzhani]|uniref:hypothetical protein n=1 Tax=Pedobacter changchengzhani TaxID=2529274 RepID=UPI00140547B5|nr:hypothetical protein [Pedobacter changchengzhani]
MKLFNIGLSLMIMAVIALPIVTVVSAQHKNLVVYGFYFCGLLELIGLIFVLVHIISIKKTNP